ncbi:unnamed protein product, partial [Ectocarpus fasciculatus]
LSQGRLNTVAHLKENQALRETLQEQVRAHLLEKAIKDREGGVADTPITDLEDDPLASPADGGAAAAAPAAKPRRRAAGSVGETLGV